MGKVVVKMKEKESAKSKKANRTIPCSWLYGPKNPLFTQPRWQENTSTDVLRARVVELGRLARKHNIDDETVKALLGLITASFVGHQLSNRFENIFLKRLSIKINQLIDQT